MVKALTSWQQDDDYSENNKAYTGVEYPLIFIPDGEISIRERHTYSMKFDISMNLYDSPCKDCTVVVIRRKTDVELIAIYKKEYKGGLKRWTNDFIKNYLNEEIELAIDEVGSGLKHCPKCKDNYSINWIKEPSYKPPTIEIPDDVLRRIKRLERERKKHVESIVSIDEMIKNLKERYGIE